jgi:hypothetical protein
LDFLDDGQNLTAVEAPLVRRGVSISHVVQKPSAPARRRSTIVIPSARPPPSTLLLVVGTNRPHPVRTADPRIADHARTFEALANDVTA